jgi:DNA-binding NtrC family response regulator
MMLSQLEQKLGRRRRITPAAMTRLAQHPFPGNVRELWNLIERLVITTDAETVDLPDLPPEVAGLPIPATGRAGGSRRLWRQTLRRVEAELLKEAMERFGSQVLAAEYLSIGQATVSRKLRQHGLR